KAPNPHMQVGHMLAAEKALLGIVRLFATDTRIAVLDEPTAALPAPDVEYLLDALGNLRRSGAAILYVAHRLPELSRIADELTVLRNGEKVDSGPISEFTIDRVVSSMLGHAAKAIQAEEVAPTIGEPLVKIQEITAPDCAPISFEIAEGEILGIVGL